METKTSRRLKKHFTSLTREFWSPHGLLSCLESEALNFTSGVTSSTCILPSISRIARTFFGLQAQDESTIFLMAGVDPPRGIRLDRSSSIPPPLTEGLPAAGNEAAAATLAVDAVEELLEGGMPPPPPPPPPSLTMLRQETSLSSRAPTFLRRSPTMLRADIRADGASDCCCPPPPLEGEFLEEDGGVSSEAEPAAAAAAAFSDLVSQSAANLLESAALLLRLTVPFRDLCRLLRSLSGMSRDVESSELRFGCLRKQGDHVPT